MPFSYLFSGFPFWWRMLKLKCALSIKLNWLLTLRTSASFDFYISQSEANSIWESIKKRSIIFAFSFSSYDQMKPSSNLDKRVSRILNRKSADRMSLIMRCYAMLKAAAPVWILKASIKQFSKISFDTSAYILQNGQRYDTMDQRNERVHRVESAGE